jgi:hypothetical protein
MVDALRRFGRFVVLDTLGEGGMGVVVRAYDPDLDRQVALKLLRSDRLASDLEARLIREAQAAARLSHPNVVTVFEVGRVDEELYVAMELVEGQTLAGWLEAAKRPTAENPGRLHPGGTRAGRGARGGHRAPRLQAGQRAARRRRARARRRFRHRSPARRRTLPGAAG